MSAYKNRIILIMSNAVTQVAAFVFALSNKKAHKRGSAADLQEETFAFAENIVISGRTWIISQDKYLTIL